MPLSTCVSRTPSSARCSRSHDKLASVQADPNLEGQFMKDTTWWFWSFNNRSPRKPFDDLRVRRAVCHMLDKPAFMGFVAGDAGVVTNQMAAPGQFFWDKAMHDADAHARPNEARARALLAEAGMDPARYYTVVIGHAPEPIANRRAVSGYSPGFTWRPGPRRARRAQLGRLHVGECRRQPRRRAEFCRLRGRGDNPGGGGAGSGARPVAGAA